MTDERLRLLGRRAAWAAVVALPLITLALVLGLRRDLSRPMRRWPMQMAESPAYLAQTANPVFASGATGRPPVPGTLPRGAASFRYAAGDEERARAGRELRNPLSPTPADLVAGQGHYETFCTVCHGAAGAGDGPVVPPYPNPPDLRLPASRDLPDGALFHTITLGRNNMPAAASQLDTAERWQVILYLRRLQGPIPAAPEGDAAAAGSSPARGGPGR